MKIFTNLFPWPGFLLCVFILVLFAANAEAAKMSPPTEQTVQEGQSLSAIGENYEVILKYSPFTKGKDVSLTTYVLDKVTNEPIQGANLVGSVSTGSENLSCIFAEKPQSVAGAYHGTIRVDSDEPYSWLFDVSLGDKNDLIAIDGFKTGGESKGTSTAVTSEPKESGNGINLTMAEIIAFIVAFMVVQAVIFFFMRKRFSLTATAKDPR